MREDAGERVLVALNFGVERAALTLPADATAATVLLSTVRGRKGALVEGSLDLPAHEGVLVELG